MYKHKLSDELEKHLSSLAQDGMDFFLLEEGTIRASIIHASRLVNEMRANHHLDILETLALGYAYMGTALSASTLKGNDRINMNMECSGDLRGFSVDANARGEIRGYLKVDSLVLNEAPESFDLSPYIGSGSLTVTRSSGENAQSFTGTVELEYGSIAQDIARYFLVSEQIPTALSLSIYFSKQGEVLGAGGIILQALPDASEQIREDLDDWIKELPSLGRLFADTHTGSGIVHQHFSAFMPELVGSRDVNFYCSCSKDVYLRYLKTLTQEDREALKEEDPEYIHIRCFNCGSEYHIAHGLLEST